jgi:hypothetical protein
LYACFTQLLLQGVVLSNTLGEQGEENAKKRIAELEKANRALRSVHSPT